MITSWIDLLRLPFRRERVDFVSVDARRFSTSPKNYEMLTSPPPQADHMPKSTGSTITSPDRESSLHEGLSTVPQSPRSLSSQYTVDYFGKEANYKSPQLSFSTPRPPSAGKGSAKDGKGRAFSPRLENNPVPELPQSDAVVRPFPTGRISPARPFSPATKETGNRPFLPAYEWDPTSTHAKASKAMSPFPKF